MRFGAATNSRVIGSGVDMQALAPMVLVSREVNGPLEHAELNEASQCVSSAC